MKLSGHQNGFVLEVIACSVHDAIEAEKGGADRLEVITDFAAGGYTPSLDLVREIRARVGLPLRIMLREESGYGLTEVIAMEKLCCVANELRKIKVDGVVLGFLRGHDVDVALNQKVLSCAPDLKATFHHAFEECFDKLAAIADVKQIPQIDKILSHGGRGTRRDRVANLAAYAEIAGPEIEILAGGRINQDMIRLLRQETAIREFHVGTAAREDGVVSALRVEGLANAVNGTYV